jgi:uncharacterized protein (UPF0335 family)
MGAKMVDQAGEAVSFAKSQLKALVERIERLEEEKKGLANDIREVYGEAKANGFDTKALRAVVRMRSQDEATRQEFEATVELYKEAMGLTPLEALAARPASSVAYPPFAHTSPPIDEQQEVPRVAAE